MGVLAITLAADSAIHKACTYHPKVIKDVQSYFVLGYLIVVVPEIPCGRVPAMKSGTSCLVANLTRGVIELSRNLDALSIKLLERVSTATRKAFIVVRRSPVYIWRSLVGIRGAPLRFLRRPLVITAAVVLKALLLITQSFTSIANLLETCDRARVTGILVGVME